MASLQSWGNRLHHPAGSKETQEKVLAPGCKPSGWGRLFAAGCEMLRVGRRRMRMMQHLPFVPPELPPH